MESVISTREEILNFLSIKQPSFSSLFSYDYGSGYGDSARCGVGSGSCSGVGSGIGDGYGDGSGTGSGYRNGTGVGSGDGFGYGSGYGYGNDTDVGYGCGIGSGDGTSYSTGDGSGSGYGKGSGSDYGYGYGNLDIKSFNGNIVDYVDLLPTIITQVSHGNIARGYIVMMDFTLNPCYIAKVGTYFAHGRTVKDAVEDANSKELRNIPIEDRIKKFIEVFGSLDSEHEGKEFYRWHHILTNSCRMGRDEFCQNHSIDLDKKYTVRYFLDITSEEYRGDIIKKIIEFYEN